MSENIETALTTPTDRNEENIYKPKSSPVLTNDETTIALQELNREDHKKIFPRLERNYADPPVAHQLFSLHSFIPSRNAKPDKNGIFGMMKIRGTFPTIEEANERSEFLVRNIDSYHSIYHGYVGRPFPITSSSDFSEKIEEVDLNKEAKKIISDDVKEKRRDEQKEIDGILDREKNLQKEVEKESEDPYEIYIMQCVKKAQLVWTYLETDKKMKQMKESIIKTREEIKKIDKEHPDFIDTYKKKYMDTRKHAGIPEDDDSFIKYLGKDVEENLGF